MKPIKSILAGVLVSSIFGLAPAHAQIPVTDTAAISKAWEGHVAELAKWVDQLKAMEQQYNQLRAQYDAITGSRGMGQLMNSATRQMLPDDFTQSYDRLLSLGQGGVSSDAQKIYDVIKKLGCSDYSAGPQRNSCEAQAYAEPENAAYIDQAIQSAQQRARELNQLLANVDSATDMKAAADLGNRIAAEQSMLANEQTLVQLALAQRQSQKSLLAEANRETGRQAVAEGKYNPFSE